MAKQSGHKLVRVFTSDGLYLHGYFVPSQKNKTAVLHIHGFEGNFYENWFVHVLAKTLENSDIAFLSVNTRGNGKDTDFDTTDENIKRVGAHYELLEEAYIDIDAWMEFLIEGGYETIILQGHSLGTVKVARYLTEGKHKDKVNKLILLSPFDRKTFIESYTKKTVEELLAKAQQKIDEGKEEERVTRDFDIAGVSYKSYVSWYKQDDFGRMFEFCTKDYDFPALKKILIPTKIIVGSKDEYFHASNPEHPEEAMKLLLDNIPNSKGKIIDGAVHSFKPYEEIMAKEVINFVLNNN